MKTVTFGPDTVISETYEQAANISDSPGEGSSQAYRMYLKSTLVYGRQRVHVSSLVDSGTSPNLLGYGAFLRLGNRRPVITAYDKANEPKLEGPSGEELSVIGYVELCVKIGSKEYPVKFKLVDNLITGCIIGSNTLKSIGAKLDFAKDCLYVKNECIPLYPADDCFNVMLSAKVTLSPGEQKSVKIKPSKKIGINSTFLFEPAAVGQIDMFHSLVDVNCNSQCSIMVNNTSNKTLTLEKGQAVGVIRPISFDRETINYLRHEELTNLCESIDPSESNEIEETSTERVNTVKHKTDSQTYIKKQLKRKSKQPMKKPTHSKDLTSDIRSDEQIIREQLKFDKSLLTPEQTEDIYNLAIKNRAAFSLRPDDMGCSKSFTYHLELKPEARLHFQPSYKLSDFETGLLKKECQKWERLGIIGKCDESKFLRFMSPALLTAKSDSSARLITDMRLLGMSLKPDRYVFPTVSEMLRRIGGEWEPGKPLYFAKLDLRDSFFQIKLDEESQSLTGFSIGTGQNFFYRRMPQGVHCSPASLARMQYNLFNDISDWVLCYADDTLVFGTSIEQLMERLDIVLGRAGRDGVKYSLSKCVMVADQVEFLGHFIKDGCVMPQKKHLDIIDSIQAPENKEGLRRLLGSVNFLSRFIHAYTDKTRPLYKLLKKESEFIWGDAEEASLQELKTYLKSHHILKLPNPKLPGWYEIYCDGSAEGGGGICFQVHRDQDGSTKRFVVGYASKPFSDADKRLLGPTELELLSLDVVLDHFRDFLFSDKEIKVYSDHQSLKGVLTGKKRVLSSKILRAIERINTFPIEILYIKGKNNQFSDFLSRDAAKNLSVLMKTPKKQMCNTIGEGDETGPRRSLRLKKPTPILNYDTLGGNDRTDISDKMEAGKIQKQFTEQHIPMVEVTWDGSASAEPTANNDAVDEPTLVQNEPLPPPEIRPIMQNEPLPRIEIMPKPDIRPKTVTPQFMKKQSTQKEQSDEPKIQGGTEEISDLRDSSLDVINKKL